MVAIDSTDSTTNRDILSSTSTDDGGIITYSLEDYYYAGNYSSAYTKTIVDALQSLIDSLRSLQSDLLMYKGWITEHEWIAWLGKQEHHRKVSLTKGHKYSTINRKTNKSTTPLKRHRWGGRRK